MPDIEAYSDIPIAAIDEPLVPIFTANHLGARQIGTDMQRFTGDEIYVRRSVLKRLAYAADMLSALDQSLKLEVRYGYRAPEIQKRLFAAARNKLSLEYSGDVLTAEAHRLIASPEVAGHPAGAAVDIQIIDEDERPLDFGTELWEFTPDSYMYSRFLTNEARRNRHLLRQVMIGAGFAPFDGEWWHFSYGDREWALWYRQSAALYEHVDFSVDDETNKQATCAAYFSSCEK